MSPAEAQFLIRMFVGAGFKPRLVSTKQYSNGRFLAVTCTNVADMFLSVIAGMTDLKEVWEFTYLVQQVSPYDVEQMGHLKAVYFASIEWTDEIAAYVAEYSAQHEEQDDDEEVTALN